MEAVIRVYRNTLFITLKLISQRGNIFTQRLFVLEFTSIKAFSFFFTSSMIYVWCIEYLFNIGSLQSFLTPYDAHKNQAKKKRKDKRKQK